MYPDLERTMRSVDLQQQISPNAIIPRYKNVRLILCKNLCYIVELHFHLSCGVSGHFGQTTPSSILPLLPSVWMVKLVQC